MATSKETTDTKGRRSGAKSDLIKVRVLKGVRQRQTELVDLIERVSTDKVNAPDGSLLPPYTPSALYNRFEESAWLRPNVDSYATNIDSFGHHFIPGIDLASKDADVRIQDAIYYERVIEAEREAKSLSDVSEPTPEEVKERKDKLRRTARLEYARLRAFFAFVCTPPLSFVGLRRRLRQDIEVTGNAYIEVARNKLGEIGRFHYVSPLNMRLMKPDLKQDTVEVEETVRVTDITWTAIPDVRVFRLFKLGSENALGSGAIYFKEFGDPRILSRASGQFYSSVDELKKAEGIDAIAATEIIHFSIFTPNSSYGIPRWIGNLPAVLGSRQLDEVNYDYFQNNVVPPLALLVAGGRFGSGTASRIEEYIDETIRGKKGMHRILVLEAEGQKSKGEPGPRIVPKVQFVPLRDAQLQDALFQQYDKRNEEKIAKSFRLPRILRGDDSQLNKATAWASLKFAEEQVFEPERQEFDEFMNRAVLPDLGITFWQFRSNSPIVRDPEVLTEMLTNLVKAGILLPSEARELSADIFNRTFIEVAEEWTNRPLPITLAQLKSGFTDDLYQQGRGRDSQSRDNQEIVNNTVSTQEGSASPVTLRRAGTPTKAIGEEEVS